MIGASSLLGAGIRKNKTSFLVGKVDHLEMRPMSFEEFLMASQKHKYIDVVK